MRNTHRVGKHPAPEGALRQTSVSLKAQQVRSVSTRHQKVH